eukprot:TRINITY_DN11845_c0_g1_i1.p1 TRINITY_DN11845_c0_g1~~TRINITY_DN11845_c0_g1_i1.p1  ORF type:complete len:517 (+),score=168.60 TRINITY_DN11845_c0_g1_i1:337-1887(+)
MKRLFRQLCTRPINITSSQWSSRINPTFLQDRHYFTPSFDRDAKFSKVSDGDLAVFRDILGDNGVITSESDPQTVDGYNVDWMKKFKGHSSVVLRPKTTEQVSRILKHCNKRMLAVVPQGGNTGLVGGSVPVFDEIVLSTALMNSTLSFDDVSGIVVCQAGVVLQALDSFLSERGFTVPIDLGAKGSCHVGGNVATNAGGVRLVRYGSLHGTVLGLEAVLADGTVIDTLSTLRKDNTGYDIKQLFIGSEGTLGVITAVSLLTPPKPKAVNVAFLGCRSFEHVKLILKQAKRELAEVLSAIEFVDRGSVEMVLKHVSGSQDPFAQSHAFYVLIETSGSNAEHDEQKLAQFLEGLMRDADPLIDDGTIAANDGQRASLWKLRESVSESLQRAGTVYKYDLSLPLDQFYPMVDAMRARIGSKGVVVGYGHIGDGNLHLNISTPRYDESVFQLVEPYVYEYTAKHRGSISAEHGLGVMKPSFLHFSKSSAVVETMRAVKRAFDPNGILNPYKVLPRPAST